MGHPSEEDENLDSGEEFSKSDQEIACGRRSKGRESPKKEGKQWCQMEQKDQRGRTPSQKQKTTGEVFLITPSVIPKELGVVLRGKWMDSSLFSSRVPF